MQISLRSQMIAGTTAFVGATAIAMTPVAPAISIPSISTAKSAVALAAFANPLAEVVATANMALNYLLNGNYSTTGAPTFSGGLSNWGAFSNLGPGLISNATNPPTVIVNNGAIGPVTNAGLTFGLLPNGSYGPSINAVGLIPDFLAQPFPILTQVINNQLGYINTALQAVNAVTGAVVNLVWTPVQLTAVVLSLALSGNINLIPAAITTAITQVVTGFQVAAGAVVNSATTIISNAIAKATAVVNTIVAEAPLLVQALQGQLTLVLNSVQNTVTAVTGALSTGNIEGAWNATVRGLLGPSGIPGTLVNLSLGAGIQVSPDIAPTTPGTLVPSTRVLVETTGQAITGALKQVAPPAASVSAAAVRAAAATSAPAAVEAAPAADATAGDNSAAAESTTAAPAASATAADSTSSDAPKASKAGAARAGR